MSKVKSVSYLKDYITFDSKEGTFWLIEHLYIQNFKIELFTPKTYNNEQLITFIHNKSKTLFDQIKRKLPIKILSKLLSTKEILKTWFEYGIYGFKDKFENGDLLDLFEFIKIKEYEVNLTLIAKYLSSVES